MHIKPCTALDRYEQKLLQGLVTRERERERHPCLSRLQFGCLYSSCCKNTPVPTLAQLISVFFSFFFLKATPLVSLVHLSAQSYREKDSYSQDRGVDVGALSVSVKGGGFFRDDARQAT